MRLSNIVNNLLTTGRTGKEQMFSQCSPWFMAFLVFFSLTGCGREPLHQSQGYVFGTLVDISIYGENEARAQQVTEHILQDFQRLHAQYHAWKKNSELERVNAAFAEGKPVAVSLELAGMMAEAASLSEQSQGLFNPAIGHLISTWGFQRDEFTPVRPDPAEITRWVQARPAMSDISISNGQAQSRNAAVKLDLGGYAKGYALDLAAAYLRQEKIHGALVNIGGNILAIGRHGDRPWRVGIQHPRQAGPLATLELPDGWAIGTSGDYQRFFEADGKRYCHIIDPRNGQPVFGTQAVTVLIPPGKHSGTLSDVVSKPLFISGVSGWRAAASNMGVEYAMLVDAAGAVHLTPAMKQRLKFESKDVRIQD